MALTETHMRFVPPLGNLTLIHCKFGRKRRVVMLVTCVPMPPLFLDWPLRLMILPLVGRLPVIAQIRAMVFLELKGRSKGLELALAREN